MRTNLPTIQSPLSAPRKAVNEAIALLATLPMKQPAKMKLLRHAYGIALDGVPAEVLDTAVRAVLQNSVGTFMPSPAELRGECDRVSYALKIEMLTSGTFDHLPSDDEMLAHLRGPALRAIKGGAR